MKLIELIEKNEAGKELSQEDCVWFVKELLNDKLKIEECETFIKGFVEKGPSVFECFCFAKAMNEGGRKIEFSTKKICVEKNSTGGYSDVVSLVATPILASLGFAVAKMSSGETENEIGSLDRLGLIDGFCPNLTDSEIEKNLNSVGMCFFKKPNDILPVEQKLVNLLKSCGLENNLVFLAILIMAKKLVLPIEVFALDVRCGEGSVLKNIVDGEKFAELLIGMGKYANMKVGGMITYATEPIEKNLGIRLELRDAILMLSRKVNYKNTELYAVCKELVFSVLSLAGLKKSKQECELLIDETIDSGLALEKLMQMVLFQRGEAVAFEKPNVLLPCENITNIIAEKSGYMTDVNLVQIKKAISIMGGLKDESGKVVDDNVGIELLVKEGKKIKKGQTLAKVYYSISNPKFAVGIRAIRDAFVIGKTVKKQVSIMKKEIADVFI